MITMSHLGVLLIPLSSKSSSAFYVCTCMFLHISIWLCAYFIEKESRTQTPILNFSLHIYILEFYEKMSRVTVSPLPALFDLNLFSHLFWCYCNISTHMCTIVHNVSLPCCVHVCVGVHATVTTAIDRSPCRASCHVEKGNTDSERDSEEDWRQNLPSDNYIVLHLLLLTLTRCRSKSFLSLYTKYFLRTKESFHRRPQ